MIKINKIMNINKRLKINEILIVNKKLGQIENIKSK